MQRQGAVVDEVELGLQVLAIEAQVFVQELQLLGRLVECPGRGEGPLAPGGEAQQPVADRDAFAGEPQLPLHRLGAGKIPARQLVGPLPLDVGVRREVGADVLVDTTEGQGIPGP